MANGPRKRREAPALRREEQRLARQHRGDARRAAREATRAARQARRAARLDAVPAAPAPVGGGMPPARISDDRIERAVAFINARADVMKGEIIAIGEYLLREFFDGDPRRVARRTPEKINSLRDLAAREDLRLSYTMLWRAVHLAIQERQLAY